jgi:hypothetical protein
MSDNSPIKTRDISDHIEDMELPLEKTFSFSNSPINPLYVFPPSLKSLKELD